MNKITMPNQDYGLIKSGAKVDRNPAIVYLAGLSEGSRRGQRGALEKMADLISGGKLLDCTAFPWHTLRYQHTSALRARLIDEYSPATVNKFLSALRGVLKESWRLGLMGAEEYQRAADLSSATGSRVPSGRELTHGELSALMASCENDKSPAGTRDASIISLLYSVGLRREELVNLNIENVDQSTGRLLIFGKRQKERTSYVTNGALDALFDWINLRGTSLGALFVSINKGGKIDRSFSKMTPQAVYNLLEKRASEAGVTKFSPHDLRRTFVSDLLEAGADISIVSKMAGHSSVNTSARYDRRPEQAKQKAASLLHVPYHKKS